jgi:hypothetical protein
MKSNKQKRAELKARKEAKRAAVALAAKRAAEQRRRDEFAAAIARGDVAVNRATRWLCAMTAVGKSYGQGRRYPSRPTKVPLRGS